MNRSNRKFSVIGPAPRKRVAGHVLVLLLLGFSSGSASGQEITPVPRDSLIEQGRFQLFWAQQLAGTETYVVRLTADTLSLESNFEYVDQGTPVRLHTSLEMLKDLSPVSFRAEGRSAPEQPIDVEVEVTGRFAKVTDGADDHFSFVAGRYFAIAGYAPAAIQMMLIRYWERHGRPRSLRVLPEGTVNVEERGRDTVAFSGQRIVLQRYAIAGVIWGTETLWTDARGKLIAAATNDADGEPFEFVRDGFAELLPYFVARGVEDAMARIEEMGRLHSLADNVTTALVGARIIEGSGLSPIEEGTIVFRRDTIVAVGLTPFVDIPPDARVIDLHGKTIIPGLWDMNAHVQQVEWGPAYLASGVTSVRDVGNGFGYVTSLRDVFNHGSGVGPRVYLAGIVFGNDARTRTDAVSLVRRYKNAAFDQIAISNTVRPAMVPVIADEAHSLDMTVSGNVPDGMDAIQAVEEGMDQIGPLSYIQTAMLPDTLRSLSANERPLPDTASFDAQAAIGYFRDHGTVIDPMLAAAEFHARGDWEPVEAFEPSISKVAPLLRRRLRAGGAKPAEAVRLRAQLENQFGVLKVLADAGIPIVAGSDKLVPGHSLHRELELFVRAGMTPMQALLSATLIPAEVMNAAQWSGTISPGKKADLVILDANPLDDIHNIRRVDRVVSRGRFYDPGDLWRRIDFQP